MCQLFQDNTALTFIQFVNVFVFNRKMNRLKIELI